MLNLRFEFSVFQSSYDSLKNEIIRDIHKAYVGFSLANSDNNIPKTIATGNWGCGAFKGNHELKFIQQWIAASFAGIEILDYYTFKDRNMILVEKYYEKINDKFKTAKELFNALLCVSSIDKNYIQNLLSIQNKQYMIFIIYTFFLFYYDNIYLYIFRVFHFQII